MLIQLLALVAYSGFAAVVLFLWGAYRLSLRNLAAFVVSGGIGFMSMAVLGNLFTNSDGQLTSGIQVSIYLGVLALGLFGGSYLGVRFFGTGAHGK